MSTPLHSTAGPATVTVLGLGRMGSALAAAFLAAGHSTTVWNRTPGKADELAARGARHAGSVAEAVAAAPLVVVCVADDEAVHQLLDPLDGALAGRTLVNLTTGTSAQARANAAWAKERGAAFLDGAIMAVYRRTSPPATRSSCTAARATPSTRTRRPCASWPRRAPPTSAGTRGSPPSTTWRCSASCGASSTASCTGRPCSARRASAPGTSPRSPPG